MNHKEIYNRIIENRKQNPLSKDEYGEKHHIVPKSEGGSDDKSNLVKLTAREHYICHLLLAKIYNDFKMYSAVIYMQTGKHTDRDFKFNSHLYAKMRIAFGLTIKGRKLSEEHRQKISEAKKNPSEETRRKISEAMKNPSEETRRKISEARKNLSEETRRKLSEATKGKHWYNNGIKNVVMYERPEGFVEGRLKF